MFALEGAVEFHHCLYMSVCVFYVHLICLCVPKSAVAGVAPHSGLFVYNYVYVCYVHFICYVFVYPSELLLESLHIQGCLYIIMYMCVMCILLFVCTQVSCCWSLYMCVMCILSVYVFVPSQLLLESLHTWVYVPE